MSRSRTLLPAPFGPMMAVMPRLLDGEIEAVDHALPARIIGEAAELERKQRTHAVNGGLETSGRYGLDQA